MLDKLKRALRGKKIEYDGDILRIELVKDKLFSFKIETGTKGPNGEKNYPWLIIEYEGKEIFKG